MSDYPSYILMWRMRASNESPVHFSPEIIAFGDVSRPSFWSKDEAIAILEGEIARLRQASELRIPQEHIDMLPPLNSSVWAIKEYGKGNWEALQAEVTEYAIHNGKLCVIMGSYYVPFDEVFKTKAEAEAFKRQSCR